MDGCKRVSKRMLNEMAWRYLEAFYHRGAGVVRLSDPIHDGKHYIYHYGIPYMFKTNRDAYRFMAEAVEEYERELGEW